MKLQYEICQDEIQILNADIRCLNVGKKMEPVLIWFGHQFWTIQINNQKVIGLEPQELVPGWNQRKVRSKLGVSYFTDRFHDLRWFCSNHVNTSGWLRDSTKFEETWTEPKVYESNPSFPSRTISGWVQTVACREHINQRAARSFI